MSHMFLTLYNDCFVTKNYSADLPDSLYNAD